MRGETDLARMLATMEPVLRPEEFGYGLIPGMAAIPAGLVPFATVREAEGLTVIAPCAALVRHGIAHRRGFACISLSVHSDLEALGLTAAFARALADAGLGANVIAGLHHDHILTSWDRREAALACLRALSRAP
ncbi:ACT domain-containing protein [Albidovulum sp.]|uniref:ACT domain-containing protein n=1 Tax=Albidovulum sp. TaxID=1872424 RepID=UPI001D232FB7|nr:ACT domain-containing protein [Paracoccaceae bacterium]MCC0045796.1 ACT domain-containing protein [Defluviimonas sp.]HPE27150.1 ACT domain-containing protein [Albidovulum sp.]MCB2138652.1 ACT domain-containing protein [Paracoccaceae bacterium]MCB2142581.1 ACT domain-containing protein [Paracoccaceae bacterium]